MLYENLNHVRKSEVAMTSFSIIRIFFVKIHKFHVFDIEPLERNF